MNKRTASLQLKLCFLFPLSTTFQARDEITKEKPEMPLLCPGQLSTNTLLTACRSRRGVPGTTVPRASALVSRETTMYRTVRARAAPDN